MIDFELYNPHNCVATDTKSPGGNSDLRARDLDTACPSYRAVRPELFMCTSCSLIGVAIKLSVRLLHCSKVAATRNKIYYPGAIDFADQVGLSQKSVQMG